MRNTATADFFLKATQQQNRPFKFEIVLGIENDIG